MPSLGKCTRLSVPIMKKGGCSEFQSVVERRRGVVGEKVFSSPLRLKGRKGGLGAGDECALDVAPLLPQHPTVEKPRLKDLE